MKCKTVNCGGYVYQEEVGYCPFCIAESRGKKIATEKKIIVSDESEIPVQHYSKPPELKGGKILTAQNVQGLCSICKKNPRAKWSDSYCKRCYAIWRKERRSRDKNSNRT